MGQRYGDRPLPAAIPSVDFELIRTTLKRHRNRETRDAWLLDQWYKKDDNSVPSQYMLLTEEVVRDSLKPQTAVEVRQSYPYLKLSNGNHGNRASSFVW